MGRGPDHLPDLWVTGIRGGVFAALVTWAIIIWDNPDRVIFPAIVGGIILVASLFIKGQKFER
jgi:hypothetical protein